jgi:hypothetical protein
MDTFVTRGTRSFDHPVERLIGMCSGGKEWLAARVEAYAREHGYVADGRETRAVWLESVADMSDAMFQAGLRHDVPAGGDGDIVARRDPVAAFGILWVRAHSNRCSSMSSWLGLLRCYQRGYADLADGAGLADDDLRDCHDFLDRFFARVEAGSRAEWARARRPGTSWRS